MPIYEYECARKHRFELKQSFTAEPVATCPSCSTTARRVIHVPPVHFKGSGFYVNDYGRKGNASEPSAGTDGAKSADGAASKDGASTASKDSASTSATPKEKSTKEEPAAAGAK